MKTSSRLQNVSFREPKQLRRWPPRGFREEGEEEELDPIKLTPSDLAEKVVILRDGGGMPFSLKDRPYLYPIYNHWHKKIVLIGGRQIEKTVSLDSHIKMANGEIKKAKDVNEGDLVATLCINEFETTISVVEWKSAVYLKPVVRVTTKQGHIAELGIDHPVKVLGKWVPAGSLLPGDRVAVAREMGEFTSSEEVDPRLLRCLAKLIGNGYVGQKSTYYTGLPGPVLWEFMEDAVSLGDDGRIIKKKGTAALNVYLYMGEISRFVDEVGLRGKDSYTKFIPKFVFNLSKDRTAEFLNRLWSAGGQIKIAAKSRYNIEYRSVNEGLIRQIQSLLHKFGIPSSVKRNWSSYWRKKGIERYSYVLRVETQEGRARFISEIGALGKTENATLPAFSKSFDTDTLPIEINDLINRVCSSVSTKRKSFKKLGVPSLKDVGLKRKLKYAPSRSKLKQYVDYFRKYPEVYDQALVDELEGHSHSQILWDEVESVQHVGVKECVDFTVVGTNNFVCDNIVTHNSTTLSNIILMPAIADKGYRSLVVFPTDTHTKTFAYDKLDGTLNVSPILIKLLGGKPRIDNLYHKEFRNGSSVLLRSAYLTARSVRGIPADQLLIDEAQEMIPDHLPVLSETLTHSHKDTFGRRIVIAGTALTNECMIGEFWEEYSTQGEWVISCKYGHDNIIEIENLSENGIICTHKHNGTCGELLDPRNGRWVHLYPSRKDSGLYVGYRIPQVINPTVHSHWDEVRIKLKTYSTAKIQQEVLGRSYESGNKPINMSQLRKAEKDVPISEGPQYVEQPIMGVDWGYGDVSFTVVTIGGWNQRNNFQIIYAKRFRLGEEIDPEYQIQYIHSLARRFNVVQIGCDWGAGWGQNARLRAKYQKVVEFIHSHGQKTLVKWQPKIFRYTLNRTESMSNLFEAFKTGRIETFKGYTEEFGSDYLNVSGQTDRFGHVIYTHSPSKPDDAVHSALYAYLIGRLMRKEIQPLVEDQ